MMLFCNLCTNPYRNLATEEVMMDHGPEELLMLWRNEPSVILGINQNAYAEVNTAYAQAQGIRVVRRLTGGGAVFHDLGNVNYTFITSDVQGGSLNFQRFCEPVIAVLRRMGIPAERSGRNDLLLEGRKISGTAQCVRNGRMMHHGTLLYAADFSRMEGVLRADAEKLESKGIRSVRSRVCNLRSWLEAQGRDPGTLPDASGFMAQLAAELGGESWQPGEELCREMDRLTREKYETWEWNYGRSKQCATTRKKRFPFGSLEAGWTLDGGVLTELSLSGDFFGEWPVQELCGALRGTRCEPQALRDALAQIPVERYIFGATAEDILSLLL